MPRLLFGLFLCLPGSLVLLFGIALVTPGLFMARAGLKRLLRYFEKQEPRPVIRNVKTGGTWIDSGGTWASSSPRMYQ